MFVTGRKIDCVMSKWGAWSKCKDCNSLRSREKTVLVNMNSVPCFVAKIKIFINAYLYFIIPLQVHPENGGRLCPLSKVQRELCRKDPKCLAPLSNSRYQY